MKWLGVLQRHDWKVDVSGAEIDPFDMLAQHARQLGPGQVASVSTTLGTSVEFGAVKCAFTVSLHCPQNEACINTAGELVFRKAIELCNDACSHLGIPPIGVDEAQ